MELRWGIQDPRSAGPSAGRRGGELMGGQAGGLFTPAQCSHPPEGAADSCLLSIPDVPAPFPPWASGSPDAGPSAGGHDCEFSVWKCLLSYVLVVISTEGGLGIWPREKVMISFLRECRTCRHGSWLPSTRSSVWHPVGTPYALAE